MLTHSKAGTSSSGGRLKKARSKRRFEKASEPIMTRISKSTKQKVERTSGANTKLRLLTADVANVFDNKTKKYAKAKIKTVIDSPADKQYIRRNILTKGTVIDTEKGKAVITNRPGQEGAINAVLI
ncbi:MAG: 30S ribosomal protein S8e [bacterium]|nr:30S ribosomal protein S8e [bacterium]